MLCSSSLADFRLAVFGEVPGYVIPFSFPHVSHRQQSGRSYVRISRAEVAFHSCPTNTPPFSRDDLIEHDRSFVLTPQIGIARERLVDQADNLDLTRKAQVAAIEIFANLHAHRLVEVPVEPEKSVKYSH